MKVKFVRKMFTKESTYKEIIAKKGAYEILMKHGVPCVFCPIIFYEMEKLRLEDISKMYGIDLERLLEDLNKLE